MLLNLSKNSTNNLEKSPQKLSKFRYNSRSYYSTMREKMKKELCLPKRTQIINDNEFTLEEIELGIRVIPQFEKEFQEMKTLGQGCSAVVKQVQRISDQKQFACKILKFRDYEQIYNIKYEYLHLKKIPPNPQIVQVYELLLDGTKQIIYIIMELVDGKEMFEVINNGEQKYNEETARCLFRQTMQGIHFLHENYICHRDLKPNNILITSDNNIKITDFNVSKFQDNYKNKFIAKNRRTIYFLFKFCLD